MKNSTSFIFSFRSFSPLIIVFLFLNFQGLSQSLKVCYIPNSRHTSGDNGYTFDGIYMSGSSTQKLINLNNFGPNGTVKKTIVLVPLTDKPITTSTISKAECGAIFVGSFYDNDITAAELNAIKIWSVQNVTNLVVVTQAETIPWGYKNENGNTNPNKPTVAGLETRIFNGPFGKVESFSQGGSYQGSLSGGSSTILATDAQNKATILLDIPTGDIILGDVDILTTLGGITTGSTVTNNNDKLFANIWAYATDLTATDQSLVTTAGTVFLDNGSGSGIAENCIREGTEGLTDFSGLPLYVKLLTCTTVSKVALVQDNGSIMLAGISNGNYTLLLDNNNNVTDITPLKRNGIVSWAGTITAGVPATAIKFCIAPDCPLPDVSTTGPVNILTGGKVIITAKDSTAKTYQWSKDKILIAGATTKSYMATEKGSYTVTMTREGCSVTSAATVIDLILANEPATAGFRITTYPNPTDGIANILVENEQGKSLQLQVVNVNGQIIQTWNITSAMKSRLFQANLPVSGLYIVRAVQNRDSKKSPESVFNKILRK